MKALLSGIPVQRHVEITKTAKHAPALPGFVSCIMYCGL